jgi:hypothetical protein
MGALVSRAAIVWDRMRWRREAMIRLADEDRPVRHRNRFEHLNVENPHGGDFTYRAECFATSRRLNP